MAENLLAEADNTPKCVRFGLDPDVIFVFPQDGDATLHAEKVKLANASDVFKAQFTSLNWNTGEPNEKIVITDISFEIFNTMIKHIYEEKTEDITGDNYVELLYASRKYFLHKLIMKIFNFKPFIRDVESLFNLSDDFGLRTLTDQIENLCKKYSKVVIPRLINFDTFAPHKRLLKVILESPVLPCTEFELYKAVLDLMKEKHMYEVIDEEKWRSELGNLIYLIRFPTMSSEELIQCAKSPSLLAKDQMLDLLLWVKERVSSHTLLSFSTVKRYQFPL